MFLKKKKKEREPGGSSEGISRGSIEAELWVRAGATLGMISWGINRKRVSCQPVRVSEPL